MMRRHKVLAILAMIALVAASGARADAAPGHARIEGTGSSWSGKAVDQWVGDVGQQGLEVGYTATGSAIGRKDFGYVTNDYAVSDIPFQGSDPLTGEEDTARGRPFAYLPVVAGGTSLTYKILVGGKMVKNLRLSGETVAKIFTNQITNWNDRQITDDNNGRQLPSLPIIPVVHSEGSGATAQFTRYLAKQYPSIWGDWAGRAVETEYFPTTKPGAHSNIIAQDKSDGVANFIYSAAGNGAIGYNEYAYALSLGLPVAKLRNDNGYFTLPTDYNVAVSLTSAHINTNKGSPDYLIQNLDDVYGQKDNRTYPLSSYSYFVLPVGAVGDPHEPRLTTAKRQTLADFLSYSVCTGQHAMGQLGYSPLPINLVQASFDQVKRLHDADSGVVISQQPVDSCDNPTFVAGHPEINHLAQVAPMPAACDKVGAGPCADGSPGGGGGGSQDAGGAGGGGGAGGSGASNQPGASSADNPTDVPAGAQIDPATGLPVGSGAGGTNADAVGTPTDLASFRAAKHIQIIGPVIAVLLLGVLIAPAVLRRQLTASDDEEDG